MIRARITAVVDVALAAVDVTATVFVMNDGDPLHRWHCSPKPPATSPSSRPAAAASRV
ncbi:hypothetical protein ABZ650_33130 [Streptomyces griseoviridis]|uniref:hypothetical protein n=1 Tax=Streptomyces griseoviridis TaxID=45398 RepID=UPI0033DE7B11